jgi:hypothetical protein
MLLELQWSIYDYFIIEKIYPFLLEIPNDDTFNKILIIIKKNKLS